MFYYWQLRPRPRIFSHADSRLTSVRDSFPAKGMYPKRSAQPSHFPGVFPSCLRTSQLSCCSYKEQRCMTNYCYSHKAMQAHAKTRQQTLSNGEVVVLHHVACSCRLRTSSFFGKCLRSPTCGKQRSKRSQSRPEGVKRLIVLHIRLPTYSLPSASISL